MSERKGHKSGGKAQEKASNSIWNKDGHDFICIPQFHNSIPSAPSGPYLRNIELLNRYQDFAVYKTSSLEKNYIWQPHFGPDLGLRLDLVDQEAILNPISIRNEDVIDASEMRLLKGDAPDRGRGKLRSLEGGEKPWWLRNTTYLENNLYSSVVQTSNNDFKRKRVGEAFVSGIETFISSFQSVEVNVKKLGREAREKMGTQIEWSIPVLPSEDMSHYFVLARFDEDPDTTLNRPAVEGEEIVPICNEAVYGILANIKQRNPDEENTKTSLTSFFTSFVLPSDEKYVPAETSAESEGTVNANESGEEKDTAVTATNIKESDSVASQIEDGTKTSGTVLNSKSVLYKWMKNFSMDVNTKVDDSFILTIEVPSGAATASASASSEKVTRGSVSYQPVRSNLLLKKVTNSDEHLSVVTRRVALE